MSLIREYRNRRRNALTRPKRPLKPRVLILLLAVVAIAYWYLTYRY